MTNVIINDYVCNTRVKLFFLPEDFNSVDQVWRKPDDVLASLQHLEFFKGKLCWGDLTPAHFRLMVAKNLNNVSYLAEEDRVDDDNVLVASLNFLICAMIRCIEHVSDSHLELVKLSRVGEYDIAVEYNAALAMEATKEQPKKLGDPFSIVVDNTKKDT